MGNVVDSGVSPQRQSRAAEVVAGATLVLDCLPRAIVVVDRDGTIVEWNKVSTRHYGWARTEAVGRSLFDLITPPALRDTGRAILSNVLDGAEWSGDVHVLLRDGSVARTYSFLRPLVDADGEVVGALAAADDPALLRELTEQASDLADRLVLALAAGRLGTWHWDMASGVTVWDPVMEELFGLPEGSFGGTFEEWVEYLHPDDRAGVLATVTEAVETASAYEVEHRVVRADGTVRWLHGRGKVTLDDQGTVTGTIGCTSDITDRKLAETTHARRLRLAEVEASRERRERERLEFLTQLNDAALTSANEHDLMQSVASAAVPRLGDWCSVYFLPEGDGVPEVVVAHADLDKVRWANSLRKRFPYDPYAPTGVPAVIRSGTTEFIESIDPAELHRLIDATGSEELDTLHEVAEQLHLTSIITVPLTSRRGVIGAIQFVSAESGRRYDRDDVALAEAAAGRLAEALTNAWLIGQQRDIAHTLQMALLPPRLPTIPGVTIATRYWAAGALTEVGGDFYDVFPLTGDRWAIVVGDVCGTGPRAAAVTAIARHTMRAAATHGHSHTEVLDWVNEAILHSNKDRFCTIAYSTLGRDDGRWRYICALGGHPRPIHLPAVGPARALGKPGTLIGAIASINVTTHETELHPGDTIILYTDGVTDQRPPHGLDENELIEIIETAASRHATADHNAARLGDAIQVLLPIDQRRDDVALLVVKIEP